MNTVPILSPRDVVKAFQKFGWEVARQRGSHIILVKEGRTFSPEASRSSEGHPQEFDSKSRFNHRGIRPCLKVVLSSQQPLL